MCVCVVRGFAQFSMERVHSRPRRASPRFFTCTHSRVRVGVGLCLVCGFHQFSMARVRSRPRRALASFFTYTRSARSRVRVRVRVRVCVPSTWFFPVFHGTGLFLSTTDVGLFFHVYLFSPLKGLCKGPCTCVCVCVCVVRGFAQFSMAQVHSSP